MNKLYRVASLQSVVMNITGFQIIVSASFTPKEKFQLMAITDAIPTQWRHHLKTCNNYQNNSSISNSAQLHLNGRNIRLDKAISKNIYKEVRSKVEIIPTAQLKYSDITSFRAFLRAFTVVAFPQGYCSIGEGPLAGG